MSRLWPAVVAALCGACGYTLQGHGTFLPPEVRSIGVPPFINHTGRPELEQRITEEILRQLQTRSRRRTTSTETGVDAVLRGEVVSYRQTPVEFNPDGRARSIEVVITARARLVPSAGGDVLWASDHFVFREAYPVGEEAATFVDTESVALQRVASYFAEAVVTSLLEGF